MLTISLILKETENGGFDKATFPYEVAKVIRKYICDLRLLRNEISWAPIRSWQVGNNRPDPYLATCPHKHCCPSITESRPPEGKLSTWVEKQWRIKQWRKQFWRRHCYLNDTIMKVVSRPHTMAKQFGRISQHFNRSLLSFATYLVRLCALDPPFLLTSTCTICKSCYVAMPLEVKCSACF